jgi:hypothetical protein
MEKFFVHYIPYRLTLRIIPKNGIGKIRYGTILDFRKYYPIKEKDELNNSYDIALYVIVMRYIKKCNTAVGKIFGVSSSDIFYCNFSIKEDGSPGIKGEYIAEVVNLQYIAMLMCQRMWLRAINKVNRYNGIGPNNFDIFVKDTIISNMEKMIFFFNMYPGLRRLIGGIILRYYSPQKANSIKL